MCVSPKSAGGHPGETTSTSPVFLLSSALPAPPGPGLPDGAVRGAAQPPKDKRVWPARAVAELRRSWWTRNMWPSRLATRQRHFKVRQSALACSKSRPYTQHHHLQHTHWRQSCQSPGRLLILRLNYCVALVPWDVKAPSTKKMSCMWRVRLWPPLSVPCAPLCVPPSHPLSDPPPSIQPLRSYLRWVECADAACMSGDSRDQDTN